MSAVELLHVQQAPANGDPLPPTSTTSAWQRRDVVMSSGLIAVGVLLWFIGWHRVSGRASFEAQLGPLNIAICGGVLVGAGQMMWFLAGRRAVAYRSCLLLAAAPRLTEVKPLLSDAPGAGGAVTGGERFFHRLGCPMAEGRPWLPSDREEHAAAGRIPCGMCNP